MKKTAPPILLTRLTEREQQMSDDYEWCLHDPEMRKRYGGKVVCVYQRKVLGVGDDHMKAWTVAKRKRGCPPKDLVAKVVVPYWIPELDDDE